MKHTTIAATAGVLWTLSLFLSLGTVPPLEISRLAAVVLGLLSLSPLVFCGTPLPHWIVTAPRISLFILLLWLLATISCAWSVSPPISLIYLGVFSVLPATVLALMISDQALRVPFLRWAGMGTGLVVAGLALWTLIQVFLIPEMLVNGQVRNPFANPNAFSGLLCLSFLAGLGLVLDMQAGTRRKMMASVLALILCALLAMAGRTAGIVLLAGVVLMAAFTMRDYARQWLILLPVAGAALITQIIIAILPGRTTIPQQFIKAVADNASTMRNRFDIWESTWNLIAANPILGSGYRTFFMMYPSVRLPSEFYSSGAMAHNDPLQLWAELGIAGPILFYTIAVLILFRFIRFRTAGNQSPLALGLFLGCGGFVAHAHSDFLFYAMPLIMVFALVLAGLLNITAHNEKENRPLAFMARWPQGTPEIAIGGPVLAFLALFNPLMLGEFYTNQASRMLEADNMAAYGRAVNTANQIGFEMNDRPYVLAVNVPLGILQAGNKNLPRTEQEKLFHQIDRLLNKALQRNSRLALAWHQRALMVQALDPAILPPGYPDAETSFKTALSINPLYLSSRTALADLYLAKGQKAEALDILAAGLSWPYPGVAALAYYKQTETLARTLNRKDLLPQIEKFRNLQNGRLESAGLSTAN